MTLKISQPPKGRAADPVAQSDSGWASLATVIAQQTESSNMQPLIQNWPSPILRRHNIFLPLNADLVSIIPHVCIQVPDLQLLHERGTEEHPYARKLLTERTTTTTTTTATTKTTKHLDPNPV